MCELDLVKRRCYIFVPAILVDHTSSPLRDTGAAYAEKVGGGYTEYSVRYKGADIN
jgi:hypothetical protein